MPAVSTSSNDADRRSSVKLERLACLVAFPLSLLLPFVAFLKHHDYGLLTPEALLSACVLTFLFGVMLLTTLPLPGGDGRSHEWRADAPPAARSDLPPGTRWAEPRQVYLQPKGGVPGPRTRWIPSRMPRF